jgi:hypothetical protein
MDADLNIGDKIYKEMREKERRRVCKTPFYNPKIWNV